MKIVLYLSSALLVLVCATWAYRVNYATQEAVNRVADLRAQISREREAIAVLRAEWAYLNRPDRLAELVVLYADTLRLTELVPEHFGEATMIAFPPEPMDPLAAAGETE